MTALTASMNMTRAASIHPGWLRAAHWLNALAVLVMLASGWRIYNASPLFDFRFPRELTLGGWLGGALQWHFAGMWLLAINGLVYLTLNAGQRPLRRASSSRSPLGDLWRDLRAALRGRLSHADPRTYNGLQRAAYLFVIADVAAAGAVGPGAVEVRAVPAAARIRWGATKARGGCTSSRWPRWWPSSPVHLMMVALVPRTLVAMIRGR